MTSGEPFDAPSARRDIYALVRRSSVRALVALATVGLCLLSVNAMLRAFPYRGDVAGVHIRAQGTLFTRPGLSADTSFGSWEFPDVDGLPIGVHVSPVNVDVLALHGDRTWSNMTVHDLRQAFLAKAPLMTAWLVGEALLGVLLGLVLAMSFSMAWRYLHGHARHEDELRVRVGEFSAALALLSLITLYGVFTFNPDWTKHSRVTGTLGAVQLFPTQLEKFYNRQSKVYDVLGAVVGIQARLQQQIDTSRTPDTALDIMFISDVHLAAVYPLIKQYAENFGVDLIVNTGDESEFGTRAELTSTFVRSIEDLTSRIPMLWVAGNHDSPDTVQVMSGIKGVTVLGGKTKSPDGSFAVTASKVDALGLTVAGVADPRVYGASGAAGADVDSVTDPLEKAAMASAVAGIAGEPSAARRFDIFATHAPVAVDELARLLPDQIRQLNAGHVHAQNSIDDITHQRGQLRLIEGSTGAGGLDNIDRNAAPPPIEFSIESVSSTCQFTKVQRFQVADPAAARDPSAALQRGEVTVSTVYFEAQHLPSSRHCGSDLGVGPVRPLTWPAAADAR
jgi:predicted MPP superfamily phosphohydrolase